MAIMAAGIHLNQQTKVEDIPVGQWSVGGLHSGHRVGGHGASRILHGSAA
jgi:hypothetical protein